MKARLLAIGVAICPVLFVSFVGFAGEKTVCRFLQLTGAIFLLMMVLAHIAEAFQLVPWMRWGQNEIPGHYLDLFSAILGLILLSLGYLFQVLSRRSRRAHANGS